MASQKVQVGKFYLISMNDTSLGYRVRVTKVNKNKIKGKYIPSRTFGWLEVTGRFWFKDIRSIEEI